MALENTWHPEGWDMMTPEEQADYSAAYWNAVAQKQVEALQLKHNPNASAGNARSAAAKNPMEAMKVIRKIQQAKAYRTNLALLDREGLQNRISANEARQMDYIDYLKTSYEKERDIESRNNAAYSEALMKSFQQRMDMNRSPATTPGYSGPSKFAKEVTTEDVMKNPDYLLAMQNQAAATERRQFQNEQNLKRSMADLDAMKRNNQRELELFDKRRTLNDQQMDEEYRNALDDLESDYPDVVSHARRGILPTTSGFGSSSISPFSSYAFYGTYDPNYDD